MKRSTPWFFSLASGLLIVLAACERVATPTPEPYPVAVVQEDRAIVREGPGSEYTSAGQVTKDSRLQIVGRNAGSDWWQVCCVRGQQVWIAGRLVQLAGATASIPLSGSIPTPLPTSTPVPPTPTPLPPTPTPMPISVEDSVIMADGQGIAVLGPKGWSRQVDELVLPGAAVADVAVDAEGRVWVIKDGGVSIFDGQKWNHYQWQLEALLCCNGVAFDSESRAWLTRLFGVSVVEEGKWTHYEAEVFGLGASPGSINDITTDAQDRVWVATGSGITVFDGSSWTPFDVSLWSSPETSGLVINEANSIAAAPDGRIWVGHNQGVSVFDGSDWVNYGAPWDEPDVDVPELSVVQAVTVAGNGSVWAVTLEGDVAALIDGQWTVYDRSNSGLLGGRGTSIAVDPQGRLWVGTGWQVTVFDGQNWISYTPATAGLPARGVTAIAFSGDGPAVLPEPENVRPGRVQGRMPQRLAGSQVYICWEVQHFLFPMYDLLGGTPCEGVTAMTTSSADGDFSIEGIPRGRYSYAVSTPNDKWTTDTVKFCPTHGSCVSLLPVDFTVDAGETVDLGDILGP
jgi:sugar lactone lactonase YvrE